MEKERRLWWSCSSSSLILSLSFSLSKTPHRSYFRPCGEPELPQPPGRRRRRSSNNRLLETQITDLDPSKRLDSEELEKDLGAGLLRRLEIHGRRLGFGSVPLTQPKMLLEPTTRRLGVSAEPKPKLIFLYPLLINKTLTIPSSILGFTIRISLPNTRLSPRGRLLAV